MTQTDIEWRLWQDIDEAESQDDGVLVNVEDLAWLLEELRFLRVQLDKAENTITEARRIADSAPEEYQGEPSYPYSFGRVDGQLRLYHNPRKAKVAA